MLVLEERSDREPCRDDKGKAHGDLKGDDEITCAPVAAARAWHLAGAPEGLLRADMESLRKGGERECDGYEGCNAG